MVFSVFQHQVHILRCYHWYWFNKCYRDRFVYRWRIKHQNDQYLSYLILPPIIGLLLQARWFSLSRHIEEWKTSSYPIRLICWTRSKMVCKPPFWLYRTDFIQLVSFLMVQNDGQKGIGLIMLVLIGSSRLVTMRRATIYQTHELYTYTIMRKPATLQHAIENTPQ